MSSTRSVPNGLYRESWLCEGSFIKVIFMPHLLHIAIFARHYNSSPLPFSSTSLPSSAFVLRQSIPIHMGGRAMPPTLPPRLVHMTSETRWLGIPTDNPLLTENPLWILWIMGQSLLDIPLAICKAWTSLRIQLNNINNKNLLIKLHLHLKLVNVSHANKRYLFFFFKFPFHIVQCIHPFPFTS